MNDKATITTSIVVTVNVEGHEPITGLLKKSEWNGMWDLAHPNGGKVIVMPEGGRFAELFDNIFGASEKLREVRVVAITPNLLVAVPSKEGAPA